MKVNPLVTTTDGRVVATDCRVTIDDYAVFRHPELGIEIARELDHPSTPLEKIAYEVESSDHRGTFYFVQLPTDGHENSSGLIGFHGAGGGGSMMSMDAVSNEGFTACKLLRYIRKSIGGKGLSCRPDHPVAARLDRLLRFRFRRRFPGAIPLRLWPCQGVQ